MKTIFIAALLMLGCIHFTVAQTNAANDYGAYKGSANNHHNVIENVVETLQGKNTISTNALEGLKVVDIIERIYALRPSNVIK